MLAFRYGDVAYDLAEGLLTRTLGFADDGTPIGAQYRQQDEYLEWFVEAIRPLRKSPRLPSPARRLRIGLHSRKAIHPNITSRTIPKLRISTPRLAASAV